MTAVAEKTETPGELINKPKQKVIEVENLVFSYEKRRPKTATPILEIDQFSLHQDEKLFIYGPSGCGKTTLLGLMAGVLEPSRGTVKILGHDLAALTRSARDAFRAAHIGYIFQMFNLLPYLSVLDNILLPISMNAARKAKLKKPPHEAARALAEALGLQDFLHAKSRALSVGQQQRVAAARALIGSPNLIIADEPTSALDADSRREFLGLLFQQCQIASTALLLVSHDRSLSTLFDRSLDLSKLNKVVAS